MLPTVRKIVAELLVALAPLCGVPCTYLISEPAAAISGLPAQQHDFQAVYAPPVAGAADDHADCQHCTAEALGRRRFGSGVRTMMPVGAALGCVRSGTLSQQRDTPPASRPGGSNTLLALSCSLLL